jgi:putative hydrolase of the HAD superfamily
MADFDVIAFDADDTLWHNEKLYLSAKEKLAEILSPYASFNEMEHLLDETELLNISLYGYGITSFTLSMIEVAINLCDRNLKKGEVQKIISIGKEMLVADVVLLDHVEEAISRLAKEFTMMIITKGDLLDQEKKLSRSGIEGYFECVEIVSEKNEQAYRKILTKYKIPPEGFLMIGNSLKSDILPVVSIGGQAVHIPVDIQWNLDVLPSEQVSSKDYYEVKHMGQLPELIQGMRVG